MSSQKHLQARLDIAKATKLNIDQYKRGVYIQRVTNHTIDALTVQACKARFALAKRFLEYATDAMKIHPRASRLVIGRSYYAMYHAARAVVYHGHGGDDHQEHSTLPTYLPADFPQVDVWKNTLRSARYDRNRVDYDPYPRSETAYADTAKASYADSTNFLAESRKYLRAKGIKL